MKFIHIITIACLAFPATSLAHMLSPSHNCSKPYKPYELQSEYEIENFKSNVKRYKSCLQGFITKQNDEALKHANAADEAADEWNNYANHELN